VGFSNRIKSWIIQCNTNEPARQGNYVKTHPVFNFNCLEHLAVYHKNKQLNVCQTGTVLTLSFNDEYYELKCVLFTIYWVSFEILSASSVYTVYVKRYGNDSRKNKYPRFLMFQRRSKLWGHS
jgi:hypothetical protein